MGRLIDEDELVEEIKSLKIVLDGKDIFPTAAKDTVLRIISEQPTAYDPDKVVEQLKEEKEFSYVDFGEYVDEVCPCLDAEYDDLFHRGLERAIEIVKGGGVDGN